MALFGSDDKNITRCNCDLDSRSISAVLKCLRILNRYGFTKNLVIKDSPSKNGFHIQAWHTGKGYTKNKIIKIRLKAGDDKIRCMLDSRSGRQIGVLFKRKHKKVVD